ncbi:hypothetical protein AR457_35480 [Streptomyces agglomeratus]|nr:hypothetical protein AR457_36895 [Streptomyces agglomeratus]OEJ36165.1 hypothetical protein AR457_35480 [Streptomyces agglomeratus]
MFAQAREPVPRLGVMPGGLALEGKFDGFRALLSIRVMPGGPVLRQLRSGSLIQRHFPTWSRAGQLPRRRSLLARLSCGSGAASGQEVFTARRRHE